MDTFGNLVRKHRGERKHPLRKVAAELGVDIAILSKIERNKRKASREQVIKLANYFGIPENEFLVVWLSDKLVYDVQDETVALQALKVAEEQVEYLNFTKTSRQHLIKLIRREIRNFPGIKKAWIYGSFARGDDGPHSDIDLALETIGDFTYFDLAEIQFQLEKLIKRKVDVGFIDSFRPHVLEHVKNDLKVIYEK
jgi:predicted nucleotidyltransferase